MVSDRFAALRRPVDVAPLAPPPPPAKTVGGVIGSASPVAGTNLVRLIVFVPHAELAASGLELDTAVSVIERPGVRMPAIRQRVVDVVDAEARRTRSGW